MTCKHKLYFYENPIEKTFKSACLICLKESNWHPSQKLAENCIDIDHIDNAIRQMYSDPEIFT